MELLGAPAGYVDDGQADFFQSRPLTVQLAGQMLAPVRDYGLVEGLHVVKGPRHRAGELDSS